MDKAKEAVSGFLHKGNHHEATIEQTVNKPVVHEELQKHKTEHTTTALDREVHEHHHQTSVQPVVDREVLPEKHHHNVMPVEHKTHHHGKDAEVERRLQEQSGQFRNESNTRETQHHRGETTALGGEHHHLHVHENIQPVIDKEVIQPHVVHNVIPVHERIDKEPTVHKATVSPTMTIDEFKNSGHLHHGTHTERHEYQGDPLKVDPTANVSIGKHQYGDREVGGYPNDRQGGVSSQQQSTMGGTSGTGLTGATSTTGHHHHNDHHHSGTAAAVGAAGVGEAAHHHHQHNQNSGMTGGTAGHNSNVANKLDPRLDSDDVGNRTGLKGSTHNTTGTMASGADHQLRDSMRDGNNPTTNTTGGHHSGGGQMIDGDVHTEAGYKDEKTGLSGLMAKITGK